MTLLQRLRFSVRAARLGVKVRTNFDYPPIPDRSMDWSAITDDYDGAEDSHCPVGRGPTELAAVADLLDQVEERAS